MLLRRFFTTTLLWLFVISLKAQIPPGYYDGTSQLSGEALQIALHQIIQNHQVRTYAQLWQDFYLTDRRQDDKVWDVYSDVPGGTAAYTYDFFTDQCGNYSGEGSCYNREHSFPASWFDDQLPMYTDLFHILPTDGYVNNRRGNHPYAEVGQASWTSTNGSRLGTSATSGYSGTAFEPIDAYKGDIARGLMYMSTRYLGEDTNWPGSEMVTGAQPKPWARQLLLQWHLLDPVSEKEINRNNAIYLIQQNRNPFIDHPEFADFIWNPAAAVAENSLQLQLWPNPVTDEAKLSVHFTEVDQDFEVTVSDISGRIVFSVVPESRTPLIKLPVNHLLPGFYLLKVTVNDSQSTTLKLIKN